MALMDGSTNPAVTAPSNENVCSACTIDVMTAMIIYHMFNERIQCQLNDQGTRLGT